MKTYNDWKRSGMRLEEFLGTTCEIGIGMFHYIAGMDIPSYMDTGGLIQASNPITRVNGVDRYMTVRGVGDKYYYLGILPEFKRIEI